MPGWNVRRGRKAFPPQQGATGQGVCPAELRGLIRAIGIAGRRSLINAFLRDWMVWLSWILAGLFLAASLSKRLVVPLVLCGFFFVLGAVVAIVRAWWTRPSSYDLACRLDSAAGLLDRLPTALHFAAAEDSNAVTLRQRRDALERLARVDAQALFPVRLPGFARSTLFLALAVSAFLVYRIHHGPPVPALVRTAGNSRIQKAVLTPMEAAVKRDLMELIKPDTSAKDFAADAETIPGLRDAKNSGDVSLPDDETNATADGTWGQDSPSSDQQTPEPGERQPGQSALKGQNGNSSQRVRQDQTNEGRQESPATQNAGRGSNGQQPETQQGNNQSSGAKSALQALKDFVKSIRGQQSQQSPPPAEYAPGDQPPSAGASSQTGNSHEHPAQGDTFKGDNDRRDASAISDPKKPGGGAGNGSTAITREGVKNPPAMPANMVRDRVDLDANGFRQEGGARTSAGPGIAQAPLRDIAPQPLAAIKGAEQENIPVRYRLYVQRYFEREDGGK